MPRRHTSSAAGVLAATMLAMVSVPVAAQDATGLRGSLGGPPLRGSLSNENASETTTGSPAASPATPEPLGGLGDGAAASGTGQSSSSSASAAATQQLRRSTADPGLRGTVVAQEATPGFGVSDNATQESVTEDPFGPPLDTPLRDNILEEDIVEDVLGLRARRLDPFVPLGTRIGTFLLFTEAEIGLISTDNVLGTPVGRSDYAFEFAPEVRLQSDWARHAFEAEFVANRSWFNTFSIEDSKTYAALLRGRLDVGARTSVGMELGKGQYQDGRNSASITDASGFQTNVQQETISLNATHTFNRLTFDVEGSSTTYDYEDITGAQERVIDAVTGISNIAQDIRDYRENELTLRGTYAFNPDMSVYVEGEIDEEDYTQPVSIAGLNRNANGYAILAGMSYAFSDALNADISLGWGEQRSVDSTVTPIEGFLFNADIVWMPTPMTLVEFVARTDIDSSNDADLLGAVSRSYRLSLQHAFWRYLVTGAFVSYETADYVDNPLFEERFRQGLTLEYFFNPNMSFYTNYEHTDFTSTDRFNEYEENLVRIGMRIRN